MQNTQLFESILSCIKQAQAHSALLTERIELLVDANDLLKERVADLEYTIDELPNLGKIIGAVQELQELHDAPASVFTHYISGGVPR
tara:strand:- start:885 stop:1145 length:261 start_codon:yes stop_codon:yes gene_type:complete